MPLNDYNDNDADVATALAASDATAWKPEPGDVLTVELVDVKNIPAREIDGQMVADYNLWIGVDRHGVMHAIHAFHTMLFNIFTENDLGIGDIVTLKYNGPVVKQNLRTGKEELAYHKYTGVVREKNFVSPVKDTGTL